MFRQKSLALLLPVLVLAMTLALTAGCGSKTESTGETATNATPGGTTESTTPAAPAAMDGATVFKTRCAICHGPDGHGDGPSSKALNPKPRNFHDMEWQKSVKDDHLMKIIKLGGEAVGKSKEMPANPDITSSQVITALKNKVRGFGGT